MNQRDRRQGRENQGRGQQALRQQRDGRGQQGFGRRGGYDEAPFDRGVRLGGGDYARMEGTDGQDRWRDDAYDRAFDRDFEHGMTPWDTRGLHGGDQSRGDMDWERRQLGDRWRGGDRGFDDRQQIGYRTSPGGYGPVGNHGGASDRGMGQSGSFGQDGDFGNARRTSHRGKGPKGYTRSDERVKELVSERLMDHHDIDASEITVEVKDGEVTLTGTVPDRETKRMVEREIESFSAVNEVINQLRIKREDDASTRSSSGNGSREKRNETGARGYEASNL